MTSAIQAKDWTTQSKLVPLAGMVVGTFLLAVAITLFFRPGAIFARGIPGLAIIVLKIIGERFKTL